MTDVENHVVQQVPEKMVLLEAMATKHKKELSQAERNLLESLASQTSLRALPNLEHGLPDCNQVRLTTPVKRHSVAGVEVEETSTSARTSSTKGVRNSFLELVILSLVFVLSGNLKHLMHHCLSSRK